MRKKQYLWLFGFVSGLAVVGLYLQRWNRQFLIQHVRTKAIPTEKGQLQLARQVQVSTVLDCPIEKAWQLVITSGLTEHLSWPCLAFTPVEGEVLPAIWKEKDLVHLHLRFMDILPLGWHRILVERIDPESYRIQTRETGQYVPTWNHSIELQKTSDDKTLYTDKIDVYAGSRTDIVAGLASWFFRYRQGRLRKLSKNLG